MASLYLTGTGSAAEIARILAGEIQNSAYSCALIDSIHHEFGGMSNHLLVFDKYYMRNESRASLTVSIIGNGSDIFVDAVGSGGSQGVFFNFSWGAEENFVGVVGEILSRYGFSCIGQK